MIELPDERATESAGARLAGALGGQGVVVTLSGELGAGKTTLVRGLLHALGHQGAVKSPTYTLIEPYELGDFRVLHLDLYRIAGGGDIEALGLRESLDEATLVLIEWPERGGAALPPADIVLRLEHAPLGRRLSISAGSERGRSVLARMSTSS